MFIEVVSSLKNYDPTPTPPPTPLPFLASFPGSLIKNGERREPGKICGKSCQLSAHGSGGTNQIAERNYKYIHVMLCPLSTILLTPYYTLKVDEKLFLDVQKGHKFKVEVHCSWFVVLTHSVYFVSLHV